MTPDDLKNFWGNNIKIQVEEEELDFVKAKEIAKQKAKELAEDPMLLSWYSGKTGEYFPKPECGTWGKTMIPHFLRYPGARNRRLRH